MTDEDQADVEILDDFSLEPDPPRIQLPPKPAEPTPAPPPATDWSGVELSELNLADLERLVDQAEAGDPVAVAAFQTFLASDGCAVWRELGDLADLAAKSLGSRLFAKHKSPPLAVRRRFEALRAELTTDDVSPLEKLAHDRVILASLFACAVDVLVAAEGVTGLTSEKRLKAQELAEKRLQAALKSLQTAREISRGAVGKPLRLFGARRPAQSNSPPLSATG